MGKPLSPETAAELRRRRRIGMLTRDQIAHIDREYPGFRWETTLAGAAEAHIRELAEFVALRKRYPRQREGLLGKWLDNQRHRKHDTTATKLLDQHFPDWRDTGPAPATFSERVMELSRFVATHGRLPKQREGSLGKWLARMRDRGTNEQQSVLDAEVPGWRTPERHPVSFSQRVQELASWLIANDHRMPGSSEVDAAEARQYQFLLAQRDRLREACDRVFSGSGTLADQKTLLEQGVLHLMLPGWSLTAQQRHERIGANLHLNALGTGKLPIRGGLDRRRLRAFRDKHKQGKLTDPIARLVAAAAPADVKPDDGTSPPAPDPRAIAQRVAAGEPWQDLLD